MAFPKSKKMMKLLYLLPILIALIVVSVYSPGVKESARDGERMRLRVVKAEDSAAIVETVHEEEFDIEPQRSPARLTAQPFTPEGERKTLYRFHFIHGPTPTGVASEIQIGENRITVRANTSYSTIYSLAESDGQYHIFYGGQLVRTLKSTTNDASIREAIPILKLDVANFLYELNEQKAKRSMESPK